MQTDIPEVVLFVIVVAVTVGGVAGGTIISWKMTGVLGKMALNMKNAVVKTAKRGANLATKAGGKALRNSKYGQATQEYMATRRNASKIKGQELYRSVGSKVPFLNYGQAQRQLFDAQNMRNYQEEVSRARGMTSLNVARAFGDIGDNVANGYDPSAGLSGANLAKIRREGGYRHGGSNKFIQFTDEDMNSLRRLDTAGFTGGNNNRAGATAAMDELFDQQFVDKKDIVNLSRVAGTDAESAALMTNSIRAAAGRNKYKNFQYGEVRSGTGAGSGYQQWIESPSTKDGVSIVQSGVQGVPKEMFEDNAILAGFTHKVSSAAQQNPEAAQRAIIDIARQTAHVDKAKVVDSIANSVGMSSNEFNKLRQEIQTNTLGDSIKNNQTPYLPDFATAWGAPGSNTPQRKQADAIKLALADAAAKRKNAADKAVAVIGGPPDYSDHDEVNNVLLTLP